MKRLRMRYAIPFYLEQILVTKFGFYVESRKFGDCISFVKPSKKSTSGQQQTFTVVSSLTTEEERKLLARCDSIVDFYPDPWQAVPAIRQRLHNIAQALPEPAREFVLKYRKENFPADLQKEAS
jgi:hypothetical protein